MKLGKPIRDKEFMLRKLNYTVWLALVATLLLAACGPEPTPESVVVTATPEPEPETVVVTATPVAPPPEEAPVEEEEMVEEEMVEEAAEEAPAEEEAAAPASEIETVLRNAQWEIVEARFEAIPFVLVPPGCFQMGDRDGFSQETPEHEQCIDTPYWIATTETTNEQFGADGFYSGDDFPRTDVTWFEARAFCESIGGRLPTEVEWEYAARGPSNLRYPFGDEFQPGFVIHAQNANGAAEVGSQPEGASWVGAVDMIGNLREWTSSDFVEYPYFGDDGREDDPPDQFPQRTVRGGSFQTGDDNLRASQREFYDPNDETSELGFRCVRDFDRIPE